MVAQLAKVASWQLLVQFPQCLHTWMQRLFFRSLWLSKINHHTYQPPNSGFYSRVLRVPVELQCVGLAKLLLTNPTRCMRQGIPRQMFRCMPRKPWYHFLTIWYGATRPWHPFAGGTHSSRLRTSLSGGSRNNYRIGAYSTTVGSRRRRAPRPKRFTATRLHTCRRRGRRRRLRIMSEFLPTLPMRPRSWTWALYGIGSTKTWTLQSIWSRDSSTSSRTRQSTWVGSWVTVGTYNMCGSWVRTSRSNTNNTGRRHNSGHNTSWYGTTIYQTWGNKESILTYTSWKLSGVSLGCLTWKGKPRGSGDPNPHHAYRSMAVGGIDWEASRAAHAPQRAMNTKWVPGTTSWKGGAVHCDTCGPTSKRIKLSVRALS